METEEPVKNRECEPNPLMAAAAFLGFLGVALGAFGAHALAEQLEAIDRVATWETAVFYHLLHAVALLALSVRRPSAYQVGVLWIVGVIIFSGSLYVLCLTGATWLGAVTPFGGLAFLAGWGWLGFFACCRKSRESF